MPTRERRLKEQAQQTGNTATLELEAPTEDQGTDEDQGAIAPTPSAPAPFRSRMTEEGFQLKELGSLYCKGVPLPPGQEKYKFFDISTAPGIYEEEIKKFRKLERDLEDAKAALNAIARPPQFQPKTGENLLFDDIQAQLAAARDEQEYERTLSIARQRISAAMDAITQQRHEVLCLAYLADLYELRKELAPVIEDYRQAVAYAHEMRNQAWEAIRQAMGKQGGCENTRPDRAAQREFFPSKMELYEIDLGGSLPPLCPTLCEFDGEVIELFPNHPTQSEYERDAPRRDAELQQWQYRMKTGYYEAGAGAKRRRGY